MGNFNSRSNEANSTDMLGAALSDGAMAGLIGGIAGSILPIMALFTRNSSAASLGFFINVLLYFATGVLAGYLYYSRKAEQRWPVAIAAVVGGFLAGLISGAATGFALSQVSLVLTQMSSNTGWIMWSALSALGGAFLAPLTAWIPGFFIRSDKGTYSYGSPISRTSTKGTAHQTMEGFFERRRKIRFVVSMTCILLIFAIYFCRDLTH